MCECVSLFFKVVLNWRPSAHSLPDRIRTVFYLSVGFALPTLLVCIQLGTNETGPTQLGLAWCGVSGVHDAVTWWTFWSVHTTTQHRERQNMAQVEGHY